MRCFPESKFFSMYFKYEKHLPAEALARAFFSVRYLFMTFLSCVSQAVYLYTDVFMKNCFPCDLTSRLLYFFIQAVPNLRYPVTNISTIADSVPRLSLARQNASHGMGIPPPKLFFLLNCSLHFFKFFLKGPFTDQVNDLIC